MLKFTKHFVFLATLILLITSSLMTGLNAALINTTNALIWGFATIVLAISSYLVFITSSHQ